MEIIKNAIIEYASIQLDRDYFLCVHLGLKFEDYNQAFGGYVLGKADDEFSPTAGNYAGIFIIQCLKIGDAESFSELKGKPIRAKTDTIWNSPITGIGHFIKDEWFIPEIVFNLTQFRDE